MSHVLAVINQKGGVGKTTTSINLATYLQKLGKSVLLVDLDPQGNASSGLGESREASPSSYELLMGEANLDRVVVEVSRLDIGLVPSGSLLAAAEIDLADKQARESRLASALKNAVHDYVIIDCPPALGLLTINALVAADSVIVPVQAEYYALEGLSQLLGVLQRVRSGLNPDVELLGVVATMFDSRTSLSDQVYQELKKHFGDKLFKTVIPRNVRLAEAPSFGKTIHEHDKWSKGARCYKQLAKEVNSRVGGK